MIREDHPQGHPEVIAQRRGGVGDAPKVCVTAAPERGRANAAVEEVLTDTLGVGRTR